MPHRASNSAPAMPIESIPEARHMGVRFPIGRLCRALLLVAVLVWLDLGLAWAHEDEVHTESGLSGSKISAIVLIGSIVVGILVGLFLWKWRGSLRPSKAHAPTRAHTRARRRRSRT